MQKYSQNYARYFYPYITPCADAHVEIQIFAIFESTIVRDNDEMILPIDS